STGVNVFLWQAPRLEANTPSTGALAHVAGNALVANTLTINGSGMSSPGQTPTVLVGGQLVSINTVPAPTDSTLTVTLPVSLDAGHNQDVEVAINGKSGAALTFTVSPWLSSLMPIRTALDSQPGPPAPTLILTGNGFTTSPQGVRLDGPGGTTNVTTF